MHLQDSKFNTTVKKRLPYNRFVKGYAKIKGQPYCYFFLGPMSHRQRGQWQDQPFRTNKG